MMQDAETIYSEVPASMQGWLASLKLAQTISNHDAPAEMKPVIHPATGRVIAEYPSGSLVDLEAAVSAAKSAFPAWAAAPWETRREKLEYLAAAIDRNRRALTLILAAETGRPLRRAWSEIFFAAANLRTIATQVLPEANYDRLGMAAQLIYRPLGVVGAITPSNAPIILAVAKVGNALITGNTVVLRPGQKTPMATLFLGQLARQIFPTGVYNTITGDASVSEAMAAHPDIAKISFTGSTAVGRVIAMAAAPSLKNVTLELGGNDAAIVLPDAEPAAVVSTVYRLSMENAGQFSAAIKRLYVHKSRYTAVRERLLMMMENAMSGSPYDPMTSLAPLQSKKQLDRVNNLLADAVTRGCKIHQSPFPRTTPGYYVAPALIEGATNGMPIVDEEQFGPVVPIIPFEDEDEAIAMANDNNYGLGGSIWTANITKGLALAARLEAGSAWVKQHGSFTAGLPLPFAKQSGNGTDYAHFGLAEHSRSMLVNARI